MRRAAHAFVRDQRNPNDCEGSAHMAHNVHCGMRVPIAIDRSRQEKLFYAWSIEMGSFVRVDRGAMAVGDDDRRTRN